MLTFNEWLDGQKGRTDAVGQFASVYARPEKSPESFEEISDRLKAATARGMIYQVAEDAWNEYSAIKQ